MGLWRAASLVLGAALVVTALQWLFGDGLGSSRHVAALSIDGVIGGDRDREEALRRIAEDDAAAALLLWIDSPGGSTYGSEALYRAVRRVAEEKPVVAVMRTVAASGGYMVALAADHIVARESTLTGSIGVLWAATNIVDLLESLGIESDTIKSEPLKAQPSPIEKLTPAGRAATQEVVDDTHRMFVAMVRERRGLDDSRLATAASGRVFTGAMAMDLGLIDALGAEHEARLWLAENRDVPVDLPLRAVSVRRDWPFTPSVVDLFRKTVLPEQLTLDGLMSLWQPSDDLR